MHYSDCFQQGDSGARCTLFECKDMFALFRKLCLKKKNEIILNTLEFLADFVKRSEGCSEKHYQYSVCGWLYRSCCVNKDKLC